MVGAALAVTGLVAVGSDSALASPRAEAPAVAVTHLNVVITDNNLYLDGPTTFPAGRVAVTFENARADKDAFFAAVRLLPGYSWHDWRVDLKKVGRNLFAPGGSKKKGLKALNHAIDNAKGYGGLGVHAGHTRSFTFLLNKESDRFFVFDDTGNLPRRVHRLNVTAPVGPQNLPATDATVIAKTNRRFAGDSVLPAKGTIKFVNNSTESPHFLELQHVKEGTTRKQVLQSFQSNQPPDFLLKGTADTDVISHNKRMAFHVNLPPGEYVEMCFFPDPEEGLPHAFMGMVHIVHLQ
jgi:hypothetical protein